MDGFAQVSERHFNGQHCVVLVSTYILGSVPWIGCCYSAVWCCNILCIEEYCDLLYSMEDDPRVVWCGVDVRKAALLILHLHYVCVSLHRDLYRTSLSAWWVHPETKTPFWISTGPFGVHIKHDDCNYGLNGFTTEGTERGRSSSSVVSEQRESQFLCGLL